MPCAIGGACPYRAGVDEAVMSQPRRSRFYVTMRFDPEEGIADLERHLDRLKRAALRRVSSSTITPRATSFRPPHSGSESGYCPADAVADGRDGDRGSPYLTFCPNQRAISFAI